MLPHTHTRLATCALANSTTAHEPRSLVQTETMELRSWEQSWRSQHNPMTSGSHTKMFQKEVAHAGTVLPFCIQAQKNVQIFWGPTAKCKKPSLKDFFVRPSQLDWWICGIPRYIGLSVWIFRTYKPLHTNRLKAFQPNVISWHVVWCWITKLFLFSDESEEGK